MPKARSAYIHVPFCGHRCGYCNFTLLAGRDDLIPAFLDALEAELAQTLAEPQTVDTIFLGGGTPSHLEPADLRRLLDMIAKWLYLEPSGEFSCEANPLDCTDVRLKVLQQGGVNRISLGGQSFNDAKLRTLERDHSGQQLAAAIERCAELLGNVSLDLIFAAPDETLEVWQRDIELALASPIRHLSTYGLTIERGSAFYGRTLKQQLTEVPTDLQLAMYRHAIDQLKQQHWEHYEVSSFCVPGFRCRHNEAYWRGEPWWAFGPGAAAFQVSDDGQSFTRTVNHRSTTAYLRKQKMGQSPVAETERLTLEDYVRERLVFGLRRLQGVQMSELDRLWLRPARALFEPYLSDYIHSGWLEQVGDSVRLTSAGLVISDSLWPDLLTG